MACNEETADRIRVALADRLEGIEEKKMFGGVGFLLNGNMVCGVHKDDLVARVGPDEYEAALEKTGAGEFEITGRPMRGWVQVEAAAVESAAAMRKWIDLCHSFAESLPSK